MTTAKQWEDKLKKLKEDVVFGTKQTKINCGTAPEYVDKFLDALGLEIEENKYKVSLEFTSDSVDSLSDLEKSIKSLIDNYLYSFELLGLQVTAKKIK